MDIKGEYSDTVTNSKKQPEEDLELYNKISGGKSRKEQYNNNWVSVNINDIVAKFAPNATPEIAKGKVIYHETNSDYSVIADIGGGYLRIKKLSAGQYVGINGETLQHYIDDNGKKHPRSKAEYMAVTHFRIKKRGEM